MGHCWQLEECSMCLRTYSFDLYINYIARTHWYCRKHPYWPYIGYFQCDFPCDQSPAEQGFVCVWDCPVWLCWSKVVLNCEGSIRQPWCHSAVFWFGKSPRGHLVLLHLESCVKIACAQFSGLCVCLLLPSIRNAVQPQFNLVCRNIGVLTDSRLSRLLPIFWQHIQAQLIKCWLSELSIIRKFLPFG